MERATALMTLGAVALLGGACNANVDVDIDIDAETVLPASEGTRSLVREARATHAPLRPDVRAAISVAPLFVRPPERIEVLPDRTRERLAVIADHVVRAETSRLFTAMGTRASEPVLLRDPATHVGVAVTLLDALPTTAEISDGWIVFRGAHASGADVLHALSDDRYEDFLRIGAPTATHAVRYRLGLSSAVAGVRLVDGVIELLDRSGAPRVRMERPTLWDGDGQRVAASPRLFDCAFDDDPAPPFDRAVVSPGSKTCTLEITWPTDLRHPLLVDPAWALASNMSTAREGHIMTTLSTGNVLVAGGSDGTQMLASAEVYNVAAASWATTSPMPDGARYAGAVTKLGGEAIVIGGVRGTTTSTPVAAVERYNTAAGTWSTLTPSSVGRVGHAVATFTNGTTQMMVTGGFNLLGSALLASSERGTGAAWTTEVISLEGRANHTATAISASNSILLAGGYGGLLTTGYMATCSLYSVTLGIGAWGPTGNLNTARKDHTATLLANGTVLVAGGIGASQTASASAETYSGGTWSNTTGGMQRARAGHTATLLADNTVLLTGGLDQSGAINATAEIYNPTTRTFALFGTPARDPTLFHTATLLGNGNAMICGGLTNILSGVPTNHCNFYNPSASFRFAYSDFSVLAPSRTSLFDALKSW